MIDEEAKKYFEKIESKLKTLKEEFSLNTREFINSIHELVWILIPETEEQGKEMYDKFNRICLTFFDNDSNKIQPYSVDEFIKLRDQLSHKILIDYQLSYKPVKDSIKIDNLGMLFKKYNNIYEILTSKE